MNIPLLFSYFPIKDPTWIFFLVLIIILFAPLIMGKLKIPHLIGMILAGIVVGEHGFNILVRDSSFELFGKVGLYYIMFLAGLEMDLEGFKRNRQKSVAFGLLTFTIPFAVGLFVGVNLLYFSWLASLLLACIFASHTLVSYPIVTRFGVSKHPSVIISIGATMIALTLSLLILAGIAGVGEGSMGVGYWSLFALKCIVYISGSIFILPRLARWFFRKYEDNVMQYIFVLAIVFFSAVMAMLAGMDGIFGAFLAGLLLNRYIPHVSPLMNRIEFVGNALFIPYFLIGVGMMINVDVLFNGGDTLLIVAVMIVVATVTKWIAAWLAQHLYRMNSTSRQMMFGLTDAHAAGALAMVIVGTQIELAPGVPLMSDDVLNGVVIMILVSCIISSVATQQAARVIALGESENVHEEDVEADEKILIPLSNPDTAENLVNIALMVRNPKRNKELMGLNVICDTAENPQQQTQSRQSLNVAVKVAAAADVSMQIQNRVGTNVTSGILHTVAERRITDIIIGLHHKANLVDSFFGKLTQGLLGGTNHQIMIVNCLIPVNTIRRILVAVPPNAEYEAGFYKWIERLARMAEQLGCRLQFFAQENTLERIRQFVRNRHVNVRGEYTTMDSWDDLMLIAGQLNFDHLLVLVCARKGSLSYQPAFEQLPDLIPRYFSNNSLMVIYPDQFGDPQEMTFAEPVVHEVSRTAYKAVGKWFNRFFIKNNDE